MNQTMKIALRSPLCPMSTVTVAGLILSLPAAMSLTHLLIPFCIVSFRVHDKDFFHKNCKYVPPRKCV